VLERLEAAAGPGEPTVWLGQFVIVAKAITPIVVPAIVAAIGGYFHVKRGRRVTIEVKTGKNTGIKITAPNAEETEKALHVFLESRNVPEQEGTKKSGGKKAKGS
jgi:hypothetical protein